MSETERKKYQFSVKADGEGNPWIMLELLEDDLSCFKNGFLGFELTDEGLKRPSEIAEYLNSNIKNVTFTTT